MNEISWYSSRSIFTAWQSRSRVPDIPILFPLIQMIPWTPAKHFKLLLTCEALENEMPQEDEQANIYEPFWGLSFDVDFWWDVLLEPDLAIRPQEARSDLAALLMCLNLSGPSKIPPYHLDMTTICNSARRFPISNFSNATALILQIQEFFQVKYRMFL